jgi:acyl-CoA reductase-like NAD-dependent aldehyde dehydrogenase
MDRDLQSIQESRDLLSRAHVAAEAFARASQPEVDRVVVAMSEAAERAAERLARSARDETGMGRYEHKVVKNRFAAVDVRDYILPLKTCGVVREDSERRVRELAVPMAFTRRSSRSRRGTPSSSPRTHVPPDACSRPSRRCTRRLRARGRQTT